MTHSDQLRQIRWRCHRGMLELDCILLNFFDKSFKDLPDTDQTLFVELLKEQDPKLWQWFLNPTEADSRFVSLIRQMVEQAKTGIARSPTH